MKVIQIEFVSEGFFAQKSCKCHILVFANFILIKIPCAVVCVTVRMCL